MRFIGRKFFQSYEKNYLCKNYKPILRINLTGHSDIGTIKRIQGEVRTPVVSGPEGMLRLIRAYRLIPFFANAVPGYSVEEHTPPEAWLTEDNLGPWDWKIECVRSGDIAYGKFLCGGKAAFATVDVFRELANWRRSLPKYKPAADQRKVLDYMKGQGSVSVPEVRRLMGVGKAAADALLGKLQMQTRIVTGDIERIYRGPDLRYSGWQRSSFCDPEALFDDSLTSSLTPAQSLEFLKETVRRACGDVPDKMLMKILGSL